MHRDKNKEKATTLSAGSSTQWLEQLKGYDFDTIIRKSRAAVKWENDGVRFSYGGENARWGDREALEQDNPKRTAKDLYRNTAGEIEARDTANRRHMDAGARKNRLPDTGDERTVFVEGSVWSAATGENETKIKEQIAANADRLNEMIPVVEKKITENLKTKRKAKEWAVEYLKSTGYRVDRQGYGTIYFSPKDIEYGLNYSDTLEEQIAIAAIPQVLKRGIVIGEHGNHKLREKATITFGAPVILNDTRVNVAVVVEKRGNRYYTHRVVLPDGRAFRLDGGTKKNVAQEAHRGVLPGKSLADATSATSTVSVPDSRQNVKPNIDGDNGVRFSLDSEGREYTMQDIGALQQERYQLKEERNRLLMANPNYAKAVEDRRYANTFQERIAASKALRAAEAEVDTAKIDARMVEIDDLITNIRETEKRKHEHERELYSGTKTAGYATLPDTRIKELDFDDPSGDRQLMLRVKAGDDSPARFAEEIDQWNRDGRPDGELFILGSTGDGKGYFCSIRKNQPHRGGPSGDVIGVHQANS